MTNSKGARQGPLATNQPPVVADSSNGGDKPTAAQLLAPGTGFLTRTDLEQLGLSRRSDDVFRACDVIVLPGHSDRWSRSRRSWRWSLTGPIAGTESDERTVHDGRGARLHRGQGLRPTGERVPTRAARQGAVDQDRFQGRRHHPQPGESMVERGPNANVGLPLQLQRPLRCRPGWTGRSQDLVGARRRVSRARHLRHADWKRRRSSHLRGAAAGRRPRGTVGVFGNIDLRGPGYIVAPGSTHPNGTTYVGRCRRRGWRRSRHRTGYWNRSRPNARLSYRSTSRWTASRPTVGLLSSGWRPSWRGAPVGQRNHTLYRAARRVLDLVDARDLEFRNAWDILRLAAGDAGLGEREIETTLASAEGGHRAAA